MGFWIEFQRYGCPLCLWEEHRGQETPESGLGEFVREIRFKDREGERSRTRALALPARVVRVSALGLSGPPSTA